MMMYNIRVVGAIVCRIHHQAEAFYGTKGLTVSRGDRWIAEKKQVKQMFAF